VNQDFKEQFQLVIATNQLYDGMPVQLNWGGMKDLLESADSPGLCFARPPSLLQAVKRVCFIFLFFILFAQQRGSTSAA